MSALHSKSQLLSKAERYSIELPLKHTPYHLLFFCVFPHRLAALQAEVDQLQQELQITQEKSTKDLATTREVIAQLESEAAHLRNDQQAVITELESQVGKRLDLTKLFSITLATKELLEISLITFPWTLIHFPSLDQL